MMDWIKVEDRLPKDGVEYLVTVEADCNEWSEQFGAPRCWVTLAYVEYHRKSGYPIWKDGYDGHALENKNDIVTAWMPTPKPFQEAKQKERE